jgi:hypothetical protein
MFLYIGFAPKMVAYTMICDGVFGWECGGTVLLIFCCISECVIFTGISLCLLKLQLCFMIPSCSRCATRLVVCIRCVTRILVASGMHIGS